MSAGCASSIGMSKIREATRPFPSTAVRRVGTETCAGTAADCEERPMWVQIIGCRSVATVAFDARDAHVAMPHGSGIYARRLSEALRARARLDYWWVEQGGAGPELLFEQVRLPRELRRRSASLVHTPNCFLPLRRPCPGVVTVHDLAFHAYPHDFSRLTGWKYRTFTPRAARSAERIVCDSEFTRRDVCERYGADEACTRVIPLAPALAAGDRVA